MILSNTHEKSEKILGASINDSHEINKLKCIQGSRCEFGTGMGHYNCRADEALSVKAPFFEKLKDKDYYKDIPNEAKKLSKRRMNINYDRFTN